MLSASTRMVWDPLRTVCNVTSNSGKVGEWRSSGSDDSDFTVTDSCTWKRGRLDRTAANARDRGHRSCSSPPLWYARSK